METDEARKLLDAIADYVTAKVNGSYYPETQTEEHWNEKAKAFAELFTAASEAGDKASPLPTAPR